MAARKILIVEDEFLIRLTLSEALSDDGFEVIEAGNGEEAIEAMTPDVAVLVTDMQLPGGMDGAEVARRARAAQPALQVIYMTGRPESVAALTTPRDAFIAKPYLPSEVCATVHRLLGSQARGG